MQILKIEQEIEELITQIVENHEFKIVRVKLMEGSRRVLQIMIEHADGSNVNVDECALISKEVSILLDIHDPISGEYDLEISSPGIDRPLVKFEDFARFSQFEIEFKLKFSHETLKRKKIIGLIKGINSENQEIVINPLDLHDQTVIITYQDIASAKLHLTDALIAAAQI